MNVKEIALEWAHKAMPRGKTISEDTSEVRAFIAGYEAGRDRALEEALNILFNPSTGGPQERYERIRDLKSAPGKDGERGREK